MLNLAILNLLQNKCYPAKPPPEVKGDLLPPASGIDAVELKRLHSYRQGHSPGTFSINFC